MDKETLSNYGWVIIVVVILAVMITLATPFGGYIKGGVKNILVSFDASLGEYGTGDDVDDPLILSGTIPSGATYTSEGIEYTGGEAFPQPISDFDTLVYGDYIYTYRTNIYGWFVESVNDKSKQRYGQICSEINGEDIVSLTQTFSSCSSLVKSPRIPSSVYSMVGAFSGCTSLITAPILPDGIELLVNTFSGCTSLTLAPIIPTGVTRMDSTFSGCTSLTSAPTIPTSVTRIEHTFSGCVNLTGTIEINATIIEIGNALEAFYGTVKPIDIIGSCACNNTVAGQYGNVTYNGAN